LIDPSKQNGGQGLSRYEGEMLLLEKLDWLELGEEWRLREKCGYTRCANGRLPGM